MARALVIKLEAPPLEATTTVPTECVLDLTGFGAVIGVEIINLAHNTRQRPPGSRGVALLGSGERVAWSYDPEADAFYVSIKEDRSREQRCAKCTVRGASDGRLVSVIVEVDGD